MDINELRNKIHGNLQEAMDLIGGKSPKKEFTIPPLQIIYYGAPGTGKSYKIDEKTTEENSVRTTFHPDSDYASFVGAYKPTMEDVPISAIVGKEVHAAVPQGSHTGKEKKIVYKYVPQAFLKAYVEAWKRYASIPEDMTNTEFPVHLDQDFMLANAAKHPYYLIIEEINRGNCAQIFGDLFQLLDRNNSGASSYPIHADEDIAQFLKEDSKGFASFSEMEKQAVAHFILRKDSGDKREIGEDILNGKLLVLPPNLHILATMNTSDQSLFPIDSAFKRRWDWEYIAIDYKPKDNGKRPLAWKFRAGDNLYDWGTFLSVINPEIESLTESADKQMGYFFAKANPFTGIISEEVFKNKVIFYLWTEVLKDYDMGKDPFINPTTNKSFKFTDFFDLNQNALENFLKNLKLEPEELQFSKEAIEGEEDTKEAKKGRGKFNNRFLLNSVTYESIGTVMQEVVSILSKDYTFDELEALLSENLNVNKAGSKGGIKRGNPGEFNRQYKEESGDNNHQLYYSTPFISKDGVEFGLINGWTSAEESKVFEFINSDRTHFPNGIIRNEVAD